MLVLLGSVVSSIFNIESISVSGTTATATAAGTDELLLLLLLLLRLLFSPLTSSVIIVITSEVVFSALGFTVMVVGIKSTVAKEYDSM